MFYVFCKILNLTEVERHICRAPIVYIIDAFYVFGGDTDKSETNNQIGKLDANLVWSKVGDLNRGRYGHSVVFDGTDAIVFGGPGRLATERCSFTSDGVSCSDQSNSDLTDYEFYPEPFMVPADYCKSLP